MRKSVVVISSALCVLGLDAPTTTECMQQQQVQVTLQVVADAPGDDNQNPNGEYAVLMNAGRDTLDLSGFTLCDAAAHCFVFPTASRIVPGGQLRVYTGVGTRDSVSYYMGSRRAVWNNDGDTATLKDTGGTTIATYTYGRAAQTPSAQPSRRAPNGGACCRVCRTGKACGNSCIARNRTCRQPPGCACNG